MTNRRKSDRVKPTLDQQFVLRIVDLSFDVEAKNISIGGIFVPEGVIFPEGALMEVELEYDGKSATSLMRVQHHQNNGAGFKFLNPSAEFNDLVDTAIHLAQQDISPARQHALH